MILVSLNIYLAVDPHLQLSVMILVSLNIYLAVDQQLQLSMILVSLNIYLALDLPLLLSVMILVSLNIYLAVDLPLLLFVMIEVCLLGMLDPHIRHILLCHSLSSADSRNSCQLLVKKCASKLYVLCIKLRYELNHAQFDLKRVEWPYKNKIFVTDFG